MGDDSLLDWSEAEKYYLKKVKLDLIICNWMRLVNISDFAFHLTYEERQVIYQLR